MKVERRFRARWNIIYSACACFLGYQGSLFVIRNVFEKFSTFGAGIAIDRMDFARVVLRSRMFISSNFFPAEIERLLYPWDTRKETDKTSLGFLNF